MDGREVAMLVPCIFFPRITCDRVNRLGENRTQQKKNVEFFLKNHKNFAFYVLPRVKSLLND